MTSDVLLSGYERTDLLDRWVQEIDEFDTCITAIDECAEMLEQCPEDVERTIIDGYRAISECYTVCTLARWHSVLGYALSAEWHHARIGDDIAVMVTEKRSN